MEAALTFLAAEAVRVGVGDTGDCVADEDGVVVTERDGDVVGDLVVVAECVGDGDADADGVVDVEAMANSCAA